MDCLIKRDQFAVSLRKQKRNEIIRLKRQSLHLAIEACQELRAMPFNDLVAWCARKRQIEYSPEQLMDGLEWHIRSELDSEGLYQAI